MAVENQQRDRLIDRQMDREVDGDRYMDRQMGRWMDRKNRQPRNTGIAGFLLYKIPID